MEILKSTYRGYSHSYHSSKYKKNKSDWNGSTPADAFRPNLSSSYQLPPRKKLWDICHNMQSKVAKYFQQQEIKVKPQVAHFYLLPPVLAALSSVGLTTFLEAKEHARTQKGLLEVYSASFIAEPQSQIISDLPVAALQKLAKMVAKIIDNRMIIQIVHKTLGIEYVEMYRAISSSMIDLNSLYSLEQCVTLNIIYGDILPPPDQHSTSITQLWKGLSQFNQPYIERFTTQDDYGLLEVASAWHVELTRKLASYFVSHGRGKAEGEEANLTIVDASIPDDQTSPDGPRICINNSDVKWHEHDPESFLAIDQESIKGLYNALDEESQKFIKDLADSVQQASGDGLSNINAGYNGLLDEVSKDPWARTPIEGTPGGGTEVDLTFGGHQMADMVYDQALDLSYDFASIKKIKERALPITRQLKRILYVSPSFEAEQILASSGANFSAASLPVYQVSENLFSQNKDLLTFGNQGESIVVLAADTSGSNSQDQIDCIKILSASWIGAAKSKKNRIEFLGATYDSGSIGGHHGTMVRWIYNERVNESRTLDHALHRVDSIVSNGGNSDVKSWARILQEVDSLIQVKPRLRKAHIYLILISDVMFNKSFSTTPFSAAAEVQEYIKSIKKKTYKDRIHLTLVSLRAGQSALDGLVDLKMTITNNEMKNPGQSAQEISAFVSRAIKQQRAKLKT
ncbi:MAG: hypothetical protein HKN76_20140 [Saprospiraceae bacterium]|nr:hypothetical protein [Saprospiraceae bacterium]